MDQTLQQIGELLLGSVPTILFFLLTWFLYRTLVHGKLIRVLDERHALTQGAMEKAKTDIAAAEAKAAAYEQSLREARATLFKQQEERRRKVLEARAAMVAEARAKAEATVKAAKVQLDKDMAEGKKTLQGQAEQLAADVIRTVLKPVGAAAAIAGGAR
jgi:F-type H+-transporting ATPase subunit b